MCEFSFNKNLNKSVKNRKNQAENRLDFCMILQIFWLPDIITITRETSPCYFFVLFSKGGGHA
jgi:hypothetical protein